MALYVGVAGATASRLALLSIAVSVTDSFRVSLNGQGAGTLEADVFFSRSTSQGNTANPLSSPGVTVGGSHLDLGIPYLCPLCPYGVSRTLTAPIRLEDPIEIALGISMGGSSWSLGIGESTRIAITELRFYDAEGNRVSLNEPVPEPGTWSLLLGGLAIITLMRSRTRH